jgi:hypothetical protein
MSELTSGQKHLLKLAHRDAAKDGWTTVSPQVLPLVKELPKELIEVEELEDGFARAKVTDKGKLILFYL